MVVLLVAGPDPVQDGYRLLGSRLLHHDWLEAALQGGVLLDVFPVVIQGGGANALKLAAGQRRLKYVGGVHGAFSGAGAHQHVHLIYEQDTVARALQLLDDLLQPFLELTTVLRPGHQAADIQGHDALALEHLRHFAFDHSLGQRLHDGCLAYAGLANKHRVVLSAAREYLHHTFDLFVTADYWIQLAGPRRGR